MVALLVDIRFNEGSLRFFFFVCVGKIRDRRCGVVLYSFAAMRYALRVAIL